LLDISSVLPCSYNAQIYRSGLASQPALFVGDKIYGTHPAAEGVGIDKVMASLRQGAVQEWIEATK